jgi:DNA-binding response OmpR family regulator
VDPTAVTRILVVDDYAAIRAICRRILNDAGYVTEEAEDGRIALELVQAGHAPFHLVIADVVMRGMSGIALLDALFLSHPSLPVLLMSTDNLTELGARSINAPCSILVKPFTAETLVAEVEFCLRKAHGGVPPKESHNLSAL